MTDIYAEMLDIKAGELRDRINTYQNSYVKQLGELQQLIASDRLSNELTEEVIRVFQVNSALYVALFVLRNKDQLGSTGLKMIQESLKIMEHYLEDKVRGAEVSHVGCGVATTVPISY